MSPNLEVQAESASLLEKDLGLEDRIPAVSSKPVKAISASSVSTSSIPTSSIATGQKRIACFIPNLDGGGAERVMIHLAEGFVEKGWAVDLVVTQVAGAYAKSLPETINLVNLQTGSPQVVNKTLALVRYFRRQQPDVFFTTLDIANVAAWARWLSGTSSRVVMIVQINLTQQFCDLYSPMVRWLRSQVVKRFYPLADDIVAVSQGVAKDVASMMNVETSQIQVIYNPVIRSDLGDRAAEPVDHPWFDSPDVPVLLGVGRLVKQKDFATLVRAFAQVRAQRPCRLVIAGYVDEREADIKPDLERLIDKLGVSADVDFLGFVENPYKYMARAQLLVLSSIYEGFGNVIVEALAVGTPVVSTDCESGPAEILADGKFGQLVPVGDRNALAAAIVDSLDNPLPTEVLKSRGRNFTIEESVRQYCDLVETY